MVSLQLAMWFCSPSIVLMATSSDVAAFMEGWGGGEDPSFGEGGGEGGLDI